MLKRKYNSFHELFLLNISTMYYRQYNIKTWLKEVWWAVVLCNRRAYETLVLLVIAMAFHSPQLQQEIRKIFSVMQFMLHFILLIAPGEDFGNYVGFYYSDLLDLHFALQMIVKHASTFTFRFIPWNTTFWSDYLLHNTILQQLGTLLLQSNWYGLLKEWKPLLVAIVFWSVSP